LTLLAARLCLVGLSAVGAGVAVHSDSAPHPAGVPTVVCQPELGNLPFYYDLYTFRGAPGRTAIVAAYAIEAGRLHTEEDEGCTQYRMVVSLVLADTAARTVSRQDDSVTVRLERTPPSSHLLRTHLEVHALPSSSTLQRVIVSDVTTPGYGQLYHAAFPIPDYSGSSLMLSDLAVGETSVEGAWTRGDVTLALLPTGRLPEGSFDLYYEIYNLPAGTPYATEITIQRLDVEGAPAGGNERDAVRTRFMGQSSADDDGVVAEIRRIDSALRPGSYRLMITIRNERTGETAVRERNFRVGA
jgi:hypothetical protein